MEQINAANCAMEVEGSGDTNRLRKNGGRGGWPWGRGRKNLRLHLPGCAPGRVETAGHGEVAGGEQRALRLDGSGGQSKESVSNKYISFNTRHFGCYSTKSTEIQQLQHCNNVKEVGVQICGNAGSGQVEKQGYSVLTECSAARSKQGSKVHIDTAFLFKYKNNVLQICTKA